MIVYMGILAAYASFDASVKSVLMHTECWVYNDKDNIIMFF